MNPSSRLFLALGALAMLAATALGALAAHALRGMLTPEMLAIFRTGVEYHFYHALGLLAVGLTAQHLPRSAFLRASGWTMAGGIVLFSGSLYLIALTGNRALGALAPIGGVAFLCAWALFLAAVARRR